MTILRLGTRGSALALTQSKWVATKLEEANSDLKVELIIIKTTGDRDQHSALNKFSGKGIFTKEIEDELLEGKIDFAVHSLKDLPTQLPQGLVLADPPKREDPRDLLISKCPLQELPLGALVATGSARRREQLRLIRSDLSFCEIRGNVGTRVRKWRDGACQATVLACAGVNRLGYEAVDLRQGEFYPLDFTSCIPAANQGLLGLELRDNDESTAKVLSTISDRDAELAFKAERAFLAELGGNCHIPAGAVTEVQSSKIKLLAFWHKPESGPLRIELEGLPEEAALLGSEAARQLKFK